MDTILYIMEVIAKREKEQPTGKFTDIHTAWTSFSENYLPYFEDDKSLYNDDDIKDRTDIKQISLNKSSPSRKRHLQLRAVSIAAIITVMLFVGTVTASALGFDLWGTVAKWTKDTFSFSNVIVNKQSLHNDLQVTLDKYSINTKVAPKWLPKGYSFESVDVTESPLRTIINSIYSIDSVNTAPPSNPPNFKSTMKIF